MPVCWTLGKRAAELQKKVDLRKSRRNVEERRTSNVWIYRCSIRNVFENILRLCHIPIPGNRKLQHNTGSYHNCSSCIAAIYCCQCLWWRNKPFFHWSTSSCLPIIQYCTVYWCSCLFSISICALEHTSFLTVNYFLIVTCVVLSNNPVSILLK